LRSQLKDFNGNWYIANLPEVIEGDESNSFEDFNYDGPHCGDAWAYTYTITCKAKDKKGTSFKATPEGVNHE